MQTNQNQKYDHLHLMQALQAGDEGALEQLFSTFNRALLFFARSMVPELEVAEEIVADSFIKLWNHRTTFETEDRVKAFLYIATKNACINHIKSAHNRQSFDKEASASLESTDPDIFVKIIRAELMQLIYQEVMKLPEKQREVFRLTYFEDLTTDEIADRLRMSATAVFANRSRAMEALRMVFKNHDKLLYSLMLYQLGERFL